MSIQLDLLTARPAAVRSTAPVSDKPRLSRQANAILARLKVGRATRRELTELALNPTARLSEIRQAGYDVQVIEWDHVSGRTVYQLFEPGQAQQ